MGQGTNDCLVSFLRMILQQKCEDFWPCLLGKNIWRMHFMISFSLIVGCCVSLHRCTLVIPKIEIKIANLRLQQYCETDLKFWQLGSSVTLRALAIWPRTRTHRTPWDRTCSPVNPQYFQFKLEEHPHDTLLYICFPSWHFRLFCK